MLDFIFILFGFIAVDSVTAHWNGPGSTKP